MKPGSGYVMREPLGVVLIIAPWNYPISLVLKPLIGAISAGNCVVIKPSEVSENCAKWLTSNITKYLDTNCIQVYEGGPQETENLLKQQFDMIFYTGNTHVGKFVMKAAAEHLTPVTLELGGKSPCIVDKDIDLETSARRIVAGKFANVGQTCVAPDYILVHDQVEDKFVDKLQQVIKEFYGDNPQSSRDYSRIINQRHTKRLEKLLQGQNVISGGSVDVQDNYISPTLVKISSDKLNSPIMQDEIFGPILPILTIHNIDEAIEFVNSRPKPLALYIFSKNTGVQKRVLETTSSGGACVNETVFHVACKTLPFGGVGPSGMGSYNGFHSFDTFSHKKSVLDRATWLDPSIRYPPYTDRKIWWFKKLGQLGKPTPTFVKLIIFFLPLVAAYWYYRSRL